MQEILSKNNNYAILLFLESICWLGGQIVEIEEAYMRAKILHQVTRIAIWQQYIGNTRWHRAVSVVPLFNGMLIEKIRHGKWYSVYIGTTEDDITWRYYSIPRDTFQQISDFEVTKIRETKHEGNSRIICAWRMTCSTCLPRHTL